MEGEAAEARLRNNFTEGTEASADSTNGSYHLGPASPAATGYLPNPAPGLRPNLRRLDCNAARLAPAAPPAAAAGPLAGLACILTVLLLRILLFF